MKSDARNKVESMADILKGLTSKEINEVVSLAKKQRIIKDNLEALFGAQIQTLKDRRCPERITELFMQAQARVVAKALKMRFKNDRIPFLPVIPCNYITVFSQMGMVLNENVAGYSSIYRNDTTPANPFSNKDIDLVKIPEEPYYIFNIEDGTKCPNEDEIERQINKCDRVCLTGIEIIALAVHSDVLSKCRIIGMNSYCNEWGVASPFLFVCGTKQPILGYVYGLNDCDEGYGIPSRDRGVMV